MHFVSDWFVTQKQIDVWYYNDEYCHDDEFIEWSNDYHSQKAQKLKIKEELLLFAWHPDHVKDWCMSEDKKKGQKNCGSSSR